jgi:carbamoyl-phosphate synthase large subunit
MNILLTSVGRRSYLVRYFQKALNGRGIVIATNSHKDATGMLAADQAIVIPDAGKDGFIEQLLEVCRKFNVRLLCSLHDWEAPFIAEALEQFRQLGVIAAVSALSVTNTCLDKYATYEFGLHKGIRVPKSALGLDNALEQLSNGRLNFPLVIKPRRGQGSIGIETVFAEDELRAGCLLAQRKISQIESNNLLAKFGEENLIIQERISGVEYGLDVVNDLQGRFAACFVKRKLAMRAGETDVAETVHSPELESFGRLIGDRLGHIGLLDVDVIVDQFGPCLLEANPRFGGHYPFSHEAGADIPAALIAWAQGKQPEAKFLQIKPGIMCLKDIIMVQAKP